MFDILGMSSKSFLFIDKMNNKDIKDNWWKEGLMIFAQVSSYIAIPIVVSLYLGKYLDSKYNTEPYIFFLLIALAFLTSMFLIWQTVKIYIKDLKEEDKNNL